MPDLGKYLFTDSEPFKIVYYPNCTFKFLIKFLTDVLLCRANPKEISLRSVNLQNKYATNWIRKSRTSNNISM